MHAAQRSRHATDLAFSETLSHTLILSTAILIENIMAAS